MTSRELVQRTVEFRNNTGRVPRQLWALVWAQLYYPEDLKRIHTDFPDDIGWAPIELRDPSPVEKGTDWEIGEYTDRWGCKWTNMQRGVVGEVKEPIVTDEDWSDTSRVHFPEELLSFDIEKVSEACRKSDKFMMAGGPRPFEQLQFIRGTENLFVDLVYPPKKLLEFMEKMHDLYCRLLEKLCRTEIDGVSFMDDWGAQKDLLINPKTWVELFKPMYRDYAEIAHRHGKKIFMHSDGNTLSIIPHLIDIGIDALNTQIFCIGVDKLAQFKGDITFWGEIDRQHILADEPVETVRRSVKLVKDTLWQDGGCIAQCEFSAGSRPENVYTVFETWEQLSR